MIHVRTMLGLGDAFAARPTIAALVRKVDQDDIVITTPWPEIFSDIVNAERVRFAKPQNLNIRCAKRNVEESRTAWVDENSDLYRDVLPGARRIQLSYHLCPGCKSIPEMIAESAGVLDQVDWSKFFINWDDTQARCCECGGGRSPLGVFRNPTIREEYKNTARNPETGAVAFAVDEIGGSWIHLNDIGRGGGEQYAERERPPFIDHVCAEYGQLSLPSMLDLVSRARCVVTPISWMAWAAMAYQAPTLCVWGGYCRPKDIFGPLYDMSGEYEVVAPEVDDFGDPCRCFNPSHDCAKSIPVERVREAAQCLK